MSQSGHELLLDVDLTARRGLRLRLEGALRDAIRSGRLPGGTRLPPTRVLARDLGISRGTVLQAYGQLVAEGWLAGRQGAGTIVAVGSGGVGPRVEEPEPLLAPWRYDLRPGFVHAGSFPRVEWMRALRRALAQAPDDAFGYGSPQGQLALRTELAGYLRRARGLEVTAADLLVTAGFTQSLGLLARSLFAVGVRRVAIEEPCWRFHRSILRDAGHELVPIDVDQHGARVEQLATSGDVGAVLLTPNRQHPTGVTLSADRRSRLLTWARETGAIVIENDYDGEFRYDGHPIGSLQGLDPGVVAYGGTASKTLAPGVRLGWLTLPDPLRESLLEAKRLTDWQTGGLEQLALATLLRTSAYDRHVRKMRLRYRRRRDALITALGAANPDLRVSGVAAGLNVLVPLPSAEVEADALAAAQAAGIGLGGIAADKFYDSGRGAGLVIGFAAAPEHTFSSAVAALADVAAQIRP